MRKTAASVIGLLRIAIAATLLAGAGCSDSPTSPSPQPPPPTPTTLSVTCPADLTAASASGAAVPVMFGTPTATGGAQPVTVSCTPASGSAFPVGPTTVRCTATANNGATASCTFVVTVAPPTPRLSRTRFLAFGDSFTAGEVTVPSAPSSSLFGGDSPWQTMILVPGASYPTQLEGLLRARYTQQVADIIVTNAGRPGESAQDGAARFPGVIGSVRPDVVLLLDGANDLALGTTAAITRAIQGVEAMAKEARFRNARVFIGTMTPPRAGGTRTLSESIVQTYNSRLRDLARGEGAMVVDLYTALLPSVTTFIGVDGLHPTEAGYRRMADTFYEAIRQELEAR